MLTILNTWYSGTIVQVIFQENSYGLFENVIQAGIKLINVNLLY